MTTGLPIKLISLAILIIPNTYISLADPSCPAGDQSGLSCLVSTPEVSYSEAEGACADIGYNLWTPQDKQPYSIIAHLADDKPMWVQTEDYKANTATPPTQGNKLSQYLSSANTN